MSNTILEKEDIDLITDLLEADNETIKDWIIYLERRKENPAFIKSLKEQTERVSEIIKKLK